jgi:hypothetical protein
VIVEEPEGFRPRDTFNPVALAVVIAIGVLVLLFIVFFIVALMFGTCQSRRRRRKAIASKFAQIDYHIRNYNNYACWLIAA